jgi:dTDP-4-dehydrorhamnose 3,5-epimerase
MGPPVISDVLLTPLKRIVGPDGDVMHALKASAAGFGGFAEAYFSEIHEGKTKKWRRHNRLTLNLIVPRGNVRFVFCDERSGRRLFSDHNVGEFNYARLTVPPGLWMAFYGSGPGTSLILNITDGEHDPGEADTKDLPAIAYDW